MQKFFFKSLLAHNLGTAALGCTHRLFLVLFLTYVAVLKVTITYMITSILPALHPPIQDYSYKRESFLSIGTKSSKEQQILQQTK